MSMTGIELIAQERERQIAEEGWDAIHDAQHNDDELALVAACYAMPERIREMTRYAYEPHPIPRLWPWDAKWWKPTPEDRDRELVKAGALIAAELDRRRASRIKP